MVVTSFSRGSTGKRFRRAGYKVKGTSKRVKKNYPGKYVSAGVVTKLRRPDFGFPDKIVTKLRYCDTVDLAGFADEIYRMNSLFDPDASIGGHQPMYFDTYATLYQKYRVRGSKITVRFAMKSAPSLAIANVAPAICAIITQPSSALVAGTASQIMEDPNSNYKVLQDKSGGNNIVMVTNTFSPSGDLGLDPEDDTMSAGVTGNPATVFHAHVVKLDQGTTTTTVTAYVEIEYLCEFFSRTEPVQS